MHNYDYLNPDKKCIKCGGENEVISSDFNYETEYETGGRPYRHKFLTLYYKCKDCGNKNNITFECEYNFE